MPIDAFVRPEEEEEYAQTLIKLMDELAPDNSIEQTFTTEIMGATWRLRRCRLVEENFSYFDDLDFDPMLDERTEKQQKSVDRARAQSHLILRRSLDELRKLQKVLESPLRGESRTIPEQIADQFPKSNPAAPPTPEPVRYTREELKAIAKADVEAILAERALGSFCKTASDLIVAGPTHASVPGPSGSFCKPGPTYPANHIGFVL